MGFSAEHFVDATGMLSGLAVWWYEEYKVLKVVVLLFYTNAPKARDNERQCGYFQRNIQTRQNPYVSMDQHLMDLEQPWQIKSLYNLTDDQLRKPPDHLSSVVPLF